MPMSFAMVALVGAIAAASPARTAETRTPLPAGPTPVEPLPAGVKRPYKDQWFTDDVHQRRTGTIVFSRERIENPGENEGAFSTAFGRKEPLYGRVYVDRSIPNTPVQTPARHWVFPAEGAHFYRLFVDGKPFDGGLGVFWSALRLSTTEAEDKQMTTWRFEPHPATADDRAMPEAGVAWAKVVNALSPGKHKLRFELWAGEIDQHSKGPRAAGEIALNVDEADFLSAGLPAPADGYRDRDRDKVKEGIRKVLAQARPPTQTDRVALKHVWSEKAGGESGATMRRILAIARTAHDAKGRVCEYRGFLVRQERSGGRWGRLKLEPSCPMPDCAPYWADCE
jgi:hypothetical protein